MGTSTNFDGAVLIIVTIGSIRNLWFTQFWLWNPWPPNRACAAARPLEGSLAPWDAAARQMMALEQGHRKKQIRKSDFMTLDAALQKSSLVNKTCLRHSYPSRGPMVAWALLLTHSAVWLYKNPKAQLLSAAENAKKASKSQAAQPWFHSVMHNCPLDSSVPKWLLLLPSCPAPACCSPQRHPHHHHHHPQHILSSLSATEAAQQGRNTKFKGSKLNSSGQ